MAYDVWPSAAVDEPDWGGTTAVSSPLLAQSPRPSSQVERDAAEMEALQRYII